MPAKPQAAFLYYSATALLQIATATKRLPIFFIFPFQFEVPSICASLCQAIGCTKRNVDGRKLFPALAQCLHSPSFGKVDCESRPFEFKNILLKLPIHRARDLIGSESQSGSIPCPHLFYTLPAKPQAAFGRPLSSAEARSNPKITPDFVGDFSHHKIEIIQERIRTADDGRKGARATLFS
jgi:hypothetical protein